MRQLLSVETQSFVKALASETRQQIMHGFVNGDALTVGEVAEQCGIGQSTASEQLAILKLGGLVTSTRAGKQVQYRPDPETIRAHLEALATYLAGCCPSQARDTRA